MKPAQVLITAALGAALASPFQDLLGSPSLEVRVIEVPAIEFKEPLKEVRSVVLSKPPSSSNTYQKIGSYTLQPGESMQSFTLDPQGTAAYIEEPGDENASSNYWYVRVSVREAGYAGGWTDHKLQGQHYIPNSDSCGGPLTNLGPGDTIYIWGRTAAPSNSFTWDARLDLFVDVTE